MPVVVLSRGRVLVENGEWKGEAGSGRFVPRHRFDRPGAMHEAKGAKATKVSLRRRFPLAHAAGSAGAGAHSRPSGGQIAKKTHAWMNLSCRSRCATIGSAPPSMTPPHWAMMTPIIHPLAQELRAWPANIMARLAPCEQALELACGTGIWTRPLLTVARHILAVDASPEMLALNRAKVADARVRYQLADLFTWEAERSGRSGVRRDVVLACPFRTAPADALDAAPRCASWRSTVHRRRAGYLSSAPTGC